MNDYSATTRELLSELMERTMDNAGRYAGHDFIGLESFEWGDVTAAAAGVANSIGWGRPNLDKIATLATAARRAVDSGHKAEFAANLQRIAEIADALAAADDITAAS